MALAASCRIGCSMRATAPAWRLAQPQIGIGGLNELAAVLKLLVANQALGARSRPS